MTDQRLRRPRLWMIVAALALVLPVHGAWAGPAGRWSQGTYIWNSAALLDPLRRDRELQDLREAGMGELLVGLNGAQVRAGAATLRQLEALIARCHARGLRVQLLLGDPAWILPGGRPELLALIARYRGLGFDGLHLDLEVEQLGWPVPAQRLRDWIATLQAAARVSPWPLTISSHPRWFENPDPAVPCVPCAIGSTVKEINLMLYQRNAERTGSRAIGIARRWPALRFRLAQSVEPGLEPGLSWYGSTPGVLQQQMQAWRQRLSPDGISGIDWQDWQSYPRRR